MKRRKYGNKKVIANGIKFDSKLEHYLYGYLQLINSDFDFQHRITLVEGFKFNGKAVRAITMLVDFIVRKNGKTYYVDTKGFPTEVSKIKYKMLKNQLKDCENVDVIWLSDEKQVNGFINSLID